MGLVAVFGCSSVVAALAGCGSHGGSGAGSPTGSPSETPTASPVWSPSTSCTPLVPPNLSVFQTQLFDGGCLSTGFVTCHTGSTPASSLALTSGLTLVEDSNIASVEVPSMKRIAPGSKSNSYFYLKLIDDPVIHTASGLSYPMPNTGQPLSQCAIDAIGAWIDAGAPNN